MRQGRVVVGSGAHGKKSRYRYTPIPGGCTFKFRPGAKTAPQEKVCAKNKIADFKYTKLTEKRTQTPPEGSLTPSVRHPQPSDTKEFHVEQFFRCKSRTYISKKKGVETL